MKFTPESGKTPFFLSKSDLIFYTFVQNLLRIHLILGCISMQFHPLAYDEIERGRTKGNSLNLMYLICYCFTQGYTRNSAQRKRGILSEIETAIKKSA